MEGLTQKDQRTRKLMSMHKALYRREDIDWLYVSRKEGGRGHATTEDSVEASIQGFEKYIKKIKERLIIAARNSTDSIMINRPTTRNGKKNNCMDISSDKQAESHVKRFGHGYEEVTLGENLSLF